ncbi:MAG: tRNA pseudouridine(55) synthase TruB [Lapillicoccus sp.]
MPGSTRATDPTGVRDGLLVVDKPSGWTSHDVVAKARWVCGTRKVGHAGTLDPMATGVLVLGIGRATRLLTFLVGCDKTYTATIRLGSTTVTDDAEGDLVRSIDTGAVTDTAIADAVRGLTGAIEQVPSSVSAIKVDGRRSYARVRGGEEVELPARPVTVHRFDVIAVRRTTVDGGLAAVDLDVEVEVSSGTYVRALARDLGTQLGVGGHLTSLRRTRVGGFGLEQAHDLAGLVDRAERTRAEGGTPGDGIPLLPMGEAARGQFLVHEVTGDEVRTIGYGQRIASAHPGAAVVAAIGPDGDLVAMLDERGPQARSLVVFPPPPPAP